MIQNQLPYWVVLAGIVTLTLGHVSEVENADPLTENLYLDNWSVIWDLELVQLTPALISHVTLAHMHNVICTTSQAQPQQCLTFLGIQSQTLSMFCYFLSDFLYCRPYSSSSTHGSSQTSNIQPAETTLPLSHANPSVTVTNTLIVWKALDVNTYSSTKSYRRDANKLLGEEMDNRFLPLMLPDKFLNKYLPLDNLKLVCPESNWPEIHIGMKKVEIYLLFVSITLHSYHPVHTEM